ncbi:response regulator transcription factor [Granulicatella seriolae]|uniref:Response regulator transcription factor n=1 Tax=Granulicatella seriolae TaxID=2967226 RepID=A0ABT1WQE4_9LACT|nr:response regulator transcription factor [Granulicatella seriolae]
MKKVLIVDDEQSILTLLLFNLEKEGYQVDQAQDGQAGLDLALNNAYDFIILDLMMPKLDGIEVCKRLRQEHVDTPVLILTAKDDEFDKIIGLELGADDYMIKPFSPREVLARMKAILRRYDKSEAKQVKATEATSPDADLGQEEEVLQAGKLTIYPERYEVLVGQDLIDLTPKEFELLVYMVKRQDRTLSRERLLDAVWNFDYSGETRIVDVHIGHLREKIEVNTKKPDYIKTVRGFGYKFEVPQDEINS